MVSFRIWNDIVPSSLWPGRNNPEKFAVSAVTRAALDVGDIALDVKIDGKTIGQLLDGAAVSKEARYQVQLRRQHLLPDLEARSVSVDM